MAIRASLPRPLGVANPVLETVSATGPAANVSVAAGGTANVDITITSQLSSLMSGAVSRVTGLPTGVAIAGLQVVDTSTLRIVAYNPTAAAVTVTANSVTAEALLIGLP